MAQGYNPVKDVLVYLSILALATSAAGQTVGPPANPFLDPKDDPYNPLRYIASNALTAIAFGKPMHLWTDPGLTMIDLALVMLTALIQTFYTFRYGAKWMVVMVIGEYGKYLSNATAWR